MNFCKEVVKLAFSKNGVCICIGTLLLMHGTTTDTQQRLFGALKKRGIHIKGGEIRIDENVLIECLKTLSNKDMNDFIEKVRQNK